MVARGQVEEKGLVMSVVKFLMALTFARIRWDTGVDTPVVCQFLLSLRFCLLVWAGCL